MTNTTDRRVGIASVVIVTVLVVLGAYNFGLHSTSTSAQATLASLNELQHTANAIVESQAALQKSMDGLAKALGNQELRQQIRATLTTASQANKQIQLKAAAPSQAQPDDPCGPATYPWMESPTAFAEHIIAHSAVTDKVPRDTAYGHQYHFMYHRYFTQLVKAKCQGATEKERTVRLLEIGPGCRMPAGPGGGVALWHSIFTAPVRFEMDVFEYAAACGKQWQTAHPEYKTKLHFGDQNDPAALNSAMEAFGRPEYDVIIDDGSHVGEHQHTSLMHLFKYVVAGGLYVVEDMHGSCRAWNAMAPEWKDENGNAAALQVTGTDDCMRNADGTATFFSTVVDWQKKMIDESDSGIYTELPGVVHIDLCLGAVVLEKDAGGGRYLQANWNKQIS